MLSFISKNWREKPLPGRAPVVNRIGNTPTKTEPKIQAERNKNIYEKGRKVSDKELTKINVIKDEFRGE